MDIIILGLAIIVTIAFWVSAWWNYKNDLPLFAIRDFICGLLWGVFVYVKIFE